MPNKTAENRKAHNLCIDCGLGKPVDGNLRCETCRTRHQANNKNLREKRKTQGQCRCGQKISGNSKLCDECQNDATNKYEDIKNQAILIFGDKCECCGEKNIKKLILSSENHINNIVLYKKIINKEILNTFRVLCKKCNRKPFKIDETNNCPCPHQAIELSQTTHQKRKLLGLCIQCGDAVSSGTITCQKCIQKLISHQKHLFLTQKCISCGENRENLKFKKCQECLNKNNLRNKNRIENRILKEQCITCGKELTNKNFKNCEECRANNQFDMLLLKIEVLLYYGGKCKCCNESRLEFLTIDHINNDGKLHREIVGGAGDHTYADIKKNNFPDDVYQVLCFNCNCGRSKNKGVCPHISIKINLNTRHFLAKKKLFSAYGACSCCGESNLLFLCIDHIKNNGSLQRRNIKGTAFYEWIIKNAYPKEYQSLCYNCNCGKQINKGIGCPHKTYTESSDAPASL